MNELSPTTRKPGLATRNVRCQRRNVAERNGFRSVDVSSGEKFDCDVFYENRLKYFVRRYVPCKQRAHKGPSQRSTGDKGGEISYDDGHDGRRGRPEIDDRRSAGNNTDVRAETFL